MTTFLLPCLMTASLLDAAVLQLEKWCRRKELNLRLRVRNSVPWSVGRRLQYGRGGENRTPTASSQNQDAGHYTTPRFFGAASQNRTAFSGFSDQRNHQTYASSDGGGDGGSRTLNFGVQNRCVPASTTSPNGWGGIGELNSCIVCHRHAPKPLGQSRHKLLEHFQ